MKRSIEDRRKSSSISIVSESSIGVIEKKNRTNPLFFLMYLEVLSNDVNNSLMIVFFLFREDQL